MPSLWVPRSDRGRPARNRLPKTSGRDARGPRRFGPFGDKLDGIGLTPPGLLHPLPDFEVNACNAWKPFPANNRS